MITAELIPPISALLGAVVGGLDHALQEDILLHKRSDWKQLAHLAVLVVFKLDNFVNEAGEVVLDRGEFDDRGERLPMSRHPTFELAGLNVHGLHSASTLYQVFDLLISTRDRVQPNGATSQIGPQAGLRP